jgi:hypothetical protein
MIQASDLKEAIARRKHERTAHRITRKHNV